MKRHVIQFIFAVFFGFSTLTGFLLASGFDQAAGQEVSDQNANSSIAVQSPDKIETEAISQHFKSIAADNDNNTSNGTTVNVNVHRAGSYITIGGRTVPIYMTNTTTDDAGSRAALYNGKFLYGHNSGSVFGHLAGLPVGTEFSITINGETTNYRISNRIVFNHDKSGGAEYLYPDWMSQGTRLNFMNSIANARWQGQQHDLSIMTCHGTMLGGGDATQRLVLYADRV